MSDLDVGLINSNSLSVAAIINGKKSQSILSLIVIAEVLHAMNICVESAERHTKSTEDKTEPSKEKS